MKTPYDTAQRAMQRGVDDLRTAIGAAAHRVAETEAQRGALAEAIVREAMVAAGDWTLPRGAWAEHVRRRRAALAEQQRAADAELDGLRGQAIELYGSLRAVEGAAERYRAEADRAAAAAEQAAGDDVAGARAARDLHRSRRARAAR